MIHKIHIFLLTCWYIICVSRFRSTNVNIRVKSTTSTSKSCRVAPTPVSWNNLTLNIKQQVSTIWKQDQYIPIAFANHLYWILSSIPRWTWTPWLAPSVLQEDIKKKLLNLGKSFLLQKIAIQINSSFTCSILEEHLPVVCI